MLFCRKVLSEGHRDYTEFTPDTPTTTELGVEGLIMPYDSCYTCLMRYKFMF